MDPTRLPHAPYSLAPGLQTVCYLRWLKVSALLRHALSCGIRAVRRVVVVRRVFFFKTDLTQTLPSVTARIPLEIRPATAADIERFAEHLKAAGLSIDDAKRRFQGGELPIIAVSGGGSPTYIGSFSRGPCRSASSASPCTFVLGTLITPTPSRCPGGAATASIPR